MKNNEIICNEKISASEVRLVNGKDSKVLPIAEALEMARNEDSDLVVIFDDKVPVVKIISVSKLLYEKQKKAKELRKNSKQITVKSLQVRIVTSAHDLEILRSKARKFLENGDKVLFKMRFKKREMSKIQESKSFFHNLVDSLNGCCSIEKDVVIGGKDASILLSPKGKTS